MLAYQELYGQDIDGNRGKLMWMYEIEASDRPEIERQVREYLISTDEPAETIIVILQNPYTDKDVYLEVNVKEYSCSH